MALRYRNGSSVSSAAAAVGETFKLKEYKNHAHVDSINGNKASGFTNLDIPKITKRVSYKDSTIERTRTSREEALLVVTGRQR